MNQIPQRVSFSPLPPFHPLLFPQVSLHCKLPGIFHLLFRIFVLLCFAPFLSSWKPKQIDRAKHKYSANSLQRPFLRKQQAVDLDFLLHSTGMQQIRPAVPWRVLAQWNHFVQWCSGLAPNFLFPKLLMQHTGEVSWLREAVSHLPPPQPQASPLQFEPHVEKKYSSCCFLLLLAPMHQYQ